MPQKALKAQKWNLSQYQVAEELVVRKVNSVVCKLIYTRGNLLGEGHKSLEKYYTGEKK